MRTYFSESKDGRNLAFAVEVLEYSGKKAKVGSVRHSLSLEILANGSTSGIPRGFIYFFSFFLFPFLWEN